MKDLERFKQDWIAHKRAKRGTKTDTFLELLRHWGFEPVCQGPCSGLATWELNGYTMIPSSGCWFNKPASRKGRGVYKLLGELLGVEDPTLSQVPDSSIAPLDHEHDGHAYRSSEQPLQPSQT